ncbi:MAG: DEAD/DEAH box helicase [Candidatus Eremiobacteraeota bacterium]|nr:DEAD/DEAH box helicase [Candidatus Eremiobacteraeota bacterium]
MPPALLRAVADLKFTVPTPVQSAAIPPALLGHDVLGSASTGSGKSAAFGLPLLTALLDKPRGKTQALILAPTRELAAQITEHLGLLAKHTNLRVAAVYGGVGFRGQASAFKRGTEIIVATPGRLLDHLAQKTASLENISILVVDEADRMLDMGFLPVVRRIIKLIPSKRQTLFFSATIPPAIAALTREMLKNPARIDLAPTTAPAEGITQTVYTVDQGRKTDLFVELLKDNAIYSAIAFTRTKARANRLAAALEKHDVRAERIHGDRSQAQRTRALADFKLGKFRVLVATDVAARGIDIVDLGHVVNYDVPAVPDDYVHRIGRTGRASAKGDAITFVAGEEEALFSQIERALGKRLDRAKNPPDFAAHAAPQAPRPNFGRRNSRPNSGPVHHPKRKR